MTMYYDSLPIKINKDAPVLIVTQVAEQIKLLISFGYLSPDDGLPPVSQLAQQLGINHNTIAGIYADLGKAGYLVAQRGRGTFIAKNEIVERSAALQNLYQKIGSVYLTAKEAGLDPAEFASAAYACATTLQDEFHSVVFVDCGNYDTPSLLECIESEIGNSATLLKLKDLKTHQKEALRQLRQADLVLTTDIHANIVSQYKALDQELIGLVFLPDLSLFTYLAALPKATKVLFVNCDDISSRTPKYFVEQIGISHIKLQEVTFEQLQNDELQLLNESEIIYTSSLMYSSIQTLLPQPNKLRQFKFSLSQASVALVKARLATKQLLKKDDMAEL